MQQWPSVTAVISTRDRPELLARAIASIQAQEYDGDVDIVVVFDQSEPDQSLTELGPRRVSVTTNTRTPGLPGGRNSGLSIATGEYIAFCDDDDEWRPTKLRTQIEMLERDPAAAVATSGITVRYDDRDADRMPDRDRVTFADLLDSRVSWVHPSTIVARRTRVLESIGLVDEEVPGGYAEDYEWLLRAALDADIVVARATLTIVHWHAKSFFAERWRTISTALQWLLDRYPQFAQHPKGIARIQGQIAFAHAAAGERGEAAKWAWKCMRANYKEARAPLALAVAAGVPVRVVLDRLHRQGRGI